MQSHFSFSPLAPSVFNRVGRKAADSAGTEVLSQFSCSGDSLKTVALSHEILPCSGV